MDIAGCEYRGFPGVCRAPPRARILDPGILKRIEHFEESIVLIIERVIISNGLYIDLCRPEYRYVLAVRSKVKDLGSN
jgi:hypothetical protein